MLQYIGITLMIVGILTTFFTSKKPRRVVVWSIVAAIVLQSLSFLLFSGIVQKNVAFLWIGAGLVVGFIFGAFIKLKRKEQTVLYHQNKIFAVSYLSLLLINQLIALLFKSYIPIVLFIAAVAVGMQVGFHLIIIFKVKKLKNIPAMLVFILMMASLLIPITASALQENILTGKWTVLPTTEVKTKYDIYIAGQAGSTSKQINSVAKEQTYILKQDGKNLQVSIEGIPVSTDKMPLTFSEINFVTSGPHFEFIGKVKTKILSQYIGGESEANIEYVVKAVMADDNNTFTADVYVYYREEYKVEGGSASIVTSSTYSVKGVRVGGAPVSATTAPATKPPATKPASNETPSNNKPPEDTNEETNDTEESIFTPQSVSDEDASTATAASGILAGLAALLSSFLGLLPKGFVLEPPIPSAPTTPIGDGPTISEPSVPNKPAKSSTPNIPPSVPNRPAVGTRRADGKIFTKNHGWQNIEFPGMQTNSLKNTISSLENDIQKHTENGDKLRTDIAKDELKRSQRELKRWKEDNETTNQAKSLENEELFQNQAKRLNAHEAELETAENVASTIGFASDVALAVGTAGVSTSLTAAKTTLTSLSLAKDITGALAEGYVKDKNMAGVITKFAVNKTISVGVGKVFDAGKLKYGVEDASNTLKAFVATSETSASNVAQKLAEDSGITGKITGAVDSADNHFKGVAKKMSDITKGGEDK